MGNKTSGWVADPAATSGFPGPGCLGSAFGGLYCDARNWGKLADTFPPIASLARIGRGVVRGLIAKLLIPSSATAEAKAESAQAVE